MRILVGPLEIIVESDEELDRLLKRFAPAPQVAATVNDFHKAVAKKPKLLEKKPIKPQVVDDGDRCRPPISRDALLKLFHGSGPKRDDAVARHFACTTEQAGEYLIHEWFERDGTMWTLSAAGFAEANKDRED